jgi:hypothetical protein
VSVAAFVASEEPRIRRYEAKPGRRCHSVSFSQHTCRRFAPCGHPIGRNKAQSEKVRQGVSNSLDDLPATRVVAPVRRKRLGRRKKKKKKKENEQSQSSFTYL